MAQPLQQQAGAYASAAVPTVGSINQQYGQSTHDVNNFTAALIHLLQQGQTGDPYASAVQSQTTANQAAVQRLQNLGSPNAPNSSMAGNPYAAGSAAAVGGMGDSALGSLNQQRGAAMQYQRQLPGIAAARGSLAVSSLETAKQSALSQRAQQYQSAYMQALQQLRDYGLQKQQVTNQAKQFAASQKYQYAALNAENARYTQGQKQQWNEFLIGQQNALNASGSTGGDTSGFTPGQVSAFKSHSVQVAEDASAHGQPIQQVINQMVQSGVPKSIATAAATTSYAHMTKPVLGQDGITTPQQLQAAMKLYNASISSWNRYMTSLNIKNNQKKYGGQQPQTGRHP